MKEIRSFCRRLHREISCANAKAVGICAAVCALVSVLFAIGGVDRHLYWRYILPRHAPSPFFLIVLWMIAYGLFGACFAMMLSSREESSHKKKTGLLFFGVLILCYVWIPIVYKAASFFLGALLVAVIFACLVVLFLQCVRISLSASLGVAGFSLWILYVFCYTLALSLLN